MDSSKQLLSPGYKEAARQSLWLQVPLFVYSLLIMDNGQTVRVFALAFAGYWFCAMALAFRRPLAPTAIDLSFWRIGLLPCFVMAMAVAWYIGRL
jgi:hypothetical protein